MSEETPDQRAERLLEEAQDAITAAFEAVAIVQRDETLRLNPNGRGKVTSHRYHALRIANALLLKAEHQLGIVESLKPGLPITGKR